MIERPGPMTLERASCERVARLARRLAGAPQAAVAFVDERGLAVVGGELTTVALPLARLLATAACHAGHPCVRDDGAHSGVAVQLKTAGDGQRAVLAVLDEAGRHWDDETIAALVDLAAGLTAELEQRAAALAAERARKERERVLNRLADAFIVVDRDWCVLEVNRVGLRMFAGVLRDAVGRSLWEVVPDALGTRWEVEYRRAMETGRPVHFEEFVQRFGVWLDVRAFPGDDGLAIFIRDVSELRAMSERLRGLLDGIDAIVWEADARTFAFSFVSQRAESLLGYPVERWLESPDFWASLIHPDDREATVASCRAATARGDHHELEYRALAADGRVIWLREVVMVVPDQNGAPARLRGMMVDVSERKRFEHELAQLGERYRILVEQMPLATYIDPVSDRAPHNYVSPQIEGISGIPYDDWLVDQQLARKITHPDDVARVQAEIEHVDRTGEPYRIDYRYVRPDGSIVWTHNQSTLVRDDAGTPLYWLGFILDITDQKRAELRLSLQNQVLELISGASPLTEILDALCRLIEQQSGGIASILLLDAEHGTVRHGAGPGLPETYRAAVDGLAIGPSAGSCGTAMWRREPVIVEDIDTSPLWDDYRELARQFGLRMCWSVPILSETGDRVLGSFAIYGTQPRVPGEQELALLTDASHLARLAIERRYADVALRESEERFRSAFEDAAVGMAITTPTGRIVRVNETLARLLGRPREALVGVDLGALVAANDVASLAAISRGLTTPADESSQTELRLRDRAGHDIWAQLSLAAVRDDAGEIIQYLAQVQDITARHTLEAELAHRAFHDPLTALPNRALLRDRLGHALLSARRERLGVALLFLDLDHFKVINDSLGHAVGDQLLVQVSRRLAQHVRECDTAARFGGDEFALVVTGISDAAAAGSIADRIFASLRRSFVVGGHELTVSGSIGISVSFGNGDQPDDLLRWADIAMYRAKASGRNRWVVFDPAEHAGALQRLARETELRRAVEQQQFVLHFQPKVELASGRIYSLEALVRWQHPERGLVAPAEFIALAEETGLIVPIGDWVLSAACRQLRAWRDTLPALAGATVSVNLSALQFRRPGLVDRVVASLDDAGLPPDALLLEITESMMMENVEATTRTLAELSALGVRLAIDDFGMEYSALSQLTNIPLDVVKIDRSFIADLGRDLADTVIVSGIIGLSHALGLIVIAEGVESEAQARQLRDLGCDIAQGFYFARPQPAEALAVCLASMPPIPAGAQQIAVAAAFGSPLVTPGEPGGDGP